MFSRRKHLLDIAFAPDPETGYVTDLKYEFFTVNEDNTVTVQQQ